MTDLINRLFQTDEGSLAYLHYYHHITRSIHRLEYELNQLHQEQWDIHEHLMSSPRFQHILWPVIQTHRICSRRSGFHPYTKRPLSRQNSMDSPPSSIPSQSSSNNKLPTEDASPPPKDAQPRSVNLPTDVDAFQGQFEIKNQPDELRPRFKPTCECCRRWGHEQPNCDTPIRSFHKCYICAWRGQRGSTFAITTMSPPPTSHNSEVTLSLTISIPNEEPAVVHHIKSGILER